jgi:threonine/homoserine/homoserine lactone efflux protein
MHSTATVLLAYAVASALLVVTPGLDTAFVLRTVAREGARQGLWASAGIVVGVFVWTAIVAAGLGFLLTTSELAYNTLRWCGAGYLLFVGFKMLRSPRAALGASGTLEARRHSVFARALLTNLLNPKVGIFFISFLPQFVPTGVAVGPFTLLLGLIHVVNTWLWFCLLVALTRPLGEWLRRAAVVRWLDRATGCIFIALGTRLALESRDT